MNHRFRFQSLLFIMCGIFLIVAISNARAQAGNIPLPGKNIKRDGQGASPATVHRNINLGEHRPGMENGGPPGFVTSIQSLPGDEFWDNRFGHPGISNGDVDAVVVDVNGSVYFGGYFSGVAGGIDSANYIVRYDPGTKVWSRLQTGLDNLVMALATDGNNIYAGGYFTHAGGGSVSYVARWDPVAGSWSPLGTGISGGASPYVAALAVYGGYLYVGGSFTTAGGVAVNNLARWSLSGSGWSDVGGGVTGISASVTAIIADSIGVCVGGNFSSAGGVAASNLAIWNGSMWASVGRGVDKRVLALARGPDGTLYTGGLFTTATDSDGTVWPVSGIAAFLFNHRWSNMQGGVSGAQSGPLLVTSLTLENGFLFVGGSFDSSGGTVTHHIAKYDHGVWHNLGAGTDARSGSGVRALASGGTRIFVGGDFLHAGTLSSSLAGIWNDSAGTWEPIAWGIQSAIPYAEVDAILVFPFDPNVVFAGGSFDYAGGVRARNIARLNIDRGSWDTLGGGIHGRVNAIAYYAGDIYVGGSFDSAGAIAVQNLARWNYIKGRWEDPGGNPDGAVNALAVYAFQLYVGGSFTAIGGVQSEGIARWDGNAWSGLEKGVQGGVFSLATDPKASNAPLYVGGTFSAFVTDSNTFVGANGVVSWDGSSFSPLGGGLNSGPVGTVRSMLLLGGVLYVGGDFVTVWQPGGNVLTPARRIAVFDGAAWYEVAGGIDPSMPYINLSVVNSLSLLPGGRVCAGGSFSVAGSGNANNIASFNGLTWAPMGSGTQSLETELPTVKASASAYPYLYVGGSFGKAGSIPELCITRWADKVSSNSSWILERIDSTISLRCVISPQSPVIYAGGTQGVIFKSTDGGTGWTKLTTGTTADIKTMATLGPAVLLAGGSQGTLLSSTDAGATWGKMSFDPVVSFNAISFGSDGKLGAAVLGKDFGPYGYFSDVYLTDDSGKTWNPAGIPHFPELYYVAVIGQNIVAVGAFGGIYRSTNAGASWDSLASGTVVALNVVHFVNDTLGFAGGNVGVILRTIDGGKTWTTVPSGTASSFYSIGFVNGELFLCGSGGVIVASSDGGMTFAIDAIIPSEVSLRGLTIVGAPPPGPARAAAAPVVFSVGDEGTVVSKQLVSTGIKASDAGVPDRFSLEQNYPNPFNPATRIQFTIGRRQLTSLRVFDLLGREVATLLNEPKDPGTYTVQFNARDLASGVYFYRLQSGGLVSVKKMLVVK